MPRAVRALPILLFLLFAVFFNTNLVTVRQSELNYLLEDASGAQEILDNSSILGRFELLKRRLEHGEGRVESYALEARIQALTAPRRPRASDSPAAIAPLVRPLRAFLNGLRFVLGKPPIHPEAEDATLGALEVAYLGERSRSYRLALQEYRRVLPAIPLGTELRATALLHVAFCESMLNATGSARVILTDVISENPGRDQSRIAWKLLGFLDLLDEKRSAALPGAPTDLDRARRAYLLVDYSTSIDLLTGFIMRHANDPRLGEAYYFRGRSHEELGELVPAIDDYRAVVSRPTAGSWTREAQRRLFLLGTVYGQGEKVARDSLGSGAASPGREFLAAVTPYARIIDPSAVGSWLSGTAAVARVPPSRPLPADAGVPLYEQGRPPDGLGEGAGVSSEAANPDGGAVIPAETPASAAAVPAAVPASTGDLFLPPLRLASFPEPAAAPLRESALPGGYAAALVAERDALARKHEREMRQRQGYNVGSWVSLGAGVASTGTMGYFLYQAFASYSKYNAATSAAQAKAMREQTLFNSSVATVAGVVGGLALASALTLQLIAPPVTPAEDRIRVLDEAIDQMGKARQ
jgi:hypothetical protein